VSEDDARSSDGPLVRALAAPLRALLGAADTVLAATLRGLGRRDAGREAASPPSLRAIAGGASVRARRRSDVARTDAPPIEDRDHASEPAIDEREIALEDLGEGRDLLLALPRDPRTVFVAWRLSSTSSAARLGRHGATTQGVHDALAIEAGDGSASRIELLQPRASSTYVQLAQAVATVRITLGTHDPDAGFLALLPPATVRLPADGAQPDASPRWRVLGSCAASPTTPPAPPSPATADILHRRATTRGADDRSDTPEIASASTGADRGRP